MALCYCPYLACLELLESDLLSSLIQRVFSPVKPTELVVEETESAIKESCHQKQTPSKDL